MNGGAVLVLLVVVVASVAALEREDYGHLEEYTDYRARPRYYYDYRVRDEHTHDYKDQWEKREGKEVKGRYALVQPDGRKRIVEYRAGKHGADYRIKFEGRGGGSGIGSYSIGHED